MGLESSDSLFDYSKPHQVLNYKCSTTSDWWGISSDYNGHCYTPMRPHEWALFARRGTRKHRCTQPIYDTGKSHTFRVITLLEIPGGPEMFVMLCRASFVYRGDWGLYRIIAIKSQRRVKPPRMSYICSRYEFVSN